MTSRDSGVDSSTGAPLGTQCDHGAQCASAVCVGGLCCSRGCGECEVCSPAGECVPHRDCTYAVCDAGVCRLALAPLGAPCESQAGCESGFCANGVCCESTCAGTCQHCGAEGYCNEFPQSDTHCEAVTCPPDTACLSYDAPRASACAGLGTCAGPEHCVPRYGGAGLSCAEGLLCDGHGECALDVATFGNATRVCPSSTVPGSIEARAGLNGEALCWLDFLFEGVVQGTVIVQGGIATVSENPASRIISVYLYNTLPMDLDPPREPTVVRSGKAQAYDASGVLLPGCVAVDNAKDGWGVTATFDGPTCRDAAYVLVTAHESLSGDL